jgi:hypothetical protein
LHLAVVFMRRFLTVICAGLAFGACASCNARYPTAPVSRQAVAVQVQYAAPTPDPRVGTPVSFVAYAVDADGAWTDVTTQATWYAADSSVLRVSPGSPTVLAVGEGVTSVIASYGGITSSTPIAVRPAAFTYPRLDFVPYFGPIRLGDYGVASALTRQDSATGATNLVTNQAVLTWSNPTVVIVSSSAVSGYFGIGPLAIGTARITATIDGQSITLNVSVAPRRN